MPRRPQSTIDNISASVRHILRQSVAGSRLPLLDTDNLATTYDYPYVPLTDTSPVRTRPALHEVFRDSGNQGDSDADGSSDVSGSVARPSVLEAGSAGVSRIRELDRQADKHDGIPIWLLYACIGAVSFVYSLDQNTTGNFLPLATSSYNRHSIIGTITTSESIINGCARPFIAKIADVTSRPTAYSVTLAFYVAGYLLVAGSSVVEEVVFGMLIYTVGHAGLNLVTELLVADLSSLKWRGLVLSLTSLPFLVNGFLGAEIVSAVLAKGNWRWGFGMFAIIMPVFLLPAIFVLRRKQSFATSTAEIRRLKLVQDGQHVEQVPYHQLVKDFMVKMDFGGLLLITISFALILLPVTLAKSAKRAWNNPFMLGMEISGFLCLGVFALYERFVSSYPLVPRRMLTNIPFLVIVTVDFWYFMSGSIRSSYLSSYVYIVKDWSTREWTYFNNASTITLCIAGPIAGLILRYTHRYKPLQIFGLSIRVLAMILMVHGSGANASSFELISTQILLGIGGAFNVVSSRVASQASVSHADLASVIALLSLGTQIGGSFGSAIATRIWASTMPRNLAKHLPDLSKEALDKLYGSISEVRSYPYNDPTRQSVIRAYEDTVGPMWKVALAASIIPVIAAFFLPNYYLGDAHNAVDPVEASTPSDDSDVDEEEEEVSRDESPVRRRSASA